MSLKFLELSVPTEDILDSLRFYQRLGFAELTAGEIWDHPYAVVSDGALTLGLHGAPDDDFKVSFVDFELRENVLKLLDAGVEFDDHVLSDSSFNQATLRSADGHCVTRLAARTFSGSPESCGQSLLGELLQVSLGVSDIMAAAHFWVPYAPRLLAESGDQESFRFDAMGLPLALVTDPAVREPTLCYRTDNPAMLHNALLSADIPLITNGALPSAAFAKIVSPEGLVIALYEADPLTKSSE